MKAWQHFKTITNHKFRVMKYCFRAGLILQGLTHDLSKYSWVEFSEGCRYFQGTRSPNNKAREEKGVSYAWLHHKGRNKHHFEYWIDYELSSKNVIGGLEMPKKYVAEMVIDRICACQTYKGSAYKQDDAYEYFLRSKDKFWFVHENTKRDLDMLLKMTAEHGEDYTLNYLKTVYLRKDL